MEAMGSEGDGEIYSIAVVRSCTGEAKTWDLKCVFLFVPPRKKKSAPEDGTPACTPDIFAILLPSQAPYLLSLLHLDPNRDSFNVLKAHARVIASICFSSRSSFCLRSSSVAFLREPFEKRLPLILILNFLILSSCGFSNIKAATVHEVIAMHYDGFPIMEP